MSVINLSRLQDTTLWQRLDRGFVDQATATDAKFLAANLVAICEEAYERMKSFPKLHPEYTLHDEVHLLRVTELMAMILGQEGVNKLNPVEIALLILSAHFHDQGMIMEDREIEALTDDPKYQLFRQAWTSEHPILAEVQSALHHSNRNITDESALHKTELQLKVALLTDYIRINHGERSAKYILSRYGTDGRWQVGGVNLADYVAKLSMSHVRPASDLTENNGFHYDASIGTYTVNLVYLGIILRLADILDFDRDRTPDSLYRSIHFTSSVSLQEWEKHKSITGWNIDSTIIRFSAACEHPEYERAVRKFMDWIDIELSASHTIINKFPKSVEDYKLDLPLVTNRERIGPKDRAYIYHDLEFSLSRDQIVKLLMTDQLYGSVNLCIRELLQNSLDALRLRRSIFRRDLEMTWENGKVDFEHKLDDKGYEVIRCADNGVGMDEQIITKFLTSVGRSYYRSPEFEQERYSLQQAGADFEPIGQFGIGFMSCFMLGDRITIRTKKDYGQGRGHGPNLFVEINGLGGIITIKEVNENYPIGTSIEIQCGKFEGIVNNFRTKAQVVKSVSEVTIATEFPVSAKCSIPSNEGEVKIPNTIFSIQTPEESNDFENIVTESFDFNILDSQLQGMIKQSFLLTDTAEGETQEITISNSEAELLPADKEKLPNGSIKRPYAEWVIRKSLTNRSIRDNIKRISFDGIYVCGDAYYEGERIASYNYGYTALVHYRMPIISGNATFTLNVRGKLKAPLTPARGPVGKHRSYPTPEWKKIEDFLAVGYARIYENLVSQKLGKVSPSVYWKLIIFNNVDIEYFRKGEVWNHLSIPCVDPNNETKWIPVSALGILSNIDPSNNYTHNSLYTENGLRCEIFDRDLWEHMNEKRSPYAISNLLVSISTITEKEGKYIITPTMPADTQQIVGADFIKYNNDKISLIPFLFDLQDVIISISNLGIANINNHVVKVARDASLKSETLPIEKLCLQLIGLLNVDIHKLIEAISGSESVEFIIKRLGVLYTMVNWEACSPELKPPYKIHVQGGKIIEITEEILLKWSELDMYHRYG